MQPVRPIETDIALLGAGHAHVEVLRRFAMRPEPGVRLTLIGREPETPYSGMLPGLIRSDYTHQEAHIDLAPLAALDTVSFYALQKGAALDQAESAPAGMRLEVLSPLLGDFGDTAAAIMALDLVITVDTSVAHLAGALGKPVWLLLPFAADWRWLEKRNDSPWYPSMRLFRQDATRRWEPVMAEVTAALRAQASQTRINCNAA